MQPRGLLRCCLYGALHGHRARNDLSCYTTTYLQNVGQERGHGARAWPLLICWSWLICSFPTEIKKKRNTSKMTKAQMTMTICIRSLPIHTHSALDYTTCFGQGNNNKLTASRAWKNSCALLVSWNKPVAACWMRDHMEANQEETIWNHLTAAYKPENPKCMRKPSHD